MLNSKHIININQNLYHIGDLTNKQQRDNSYESNTLSVSVHPEEWIKIAKLGGKNKYSLFKSNAKFLNIISVENDNLLMKNITNWGILNNYIYLDTLYKVSYYDDEMECELISLYNTHLEAEKEAPTPEDITVIKNSLLSTQNLNDKRNNGKEIEPINVKRFLIFQYAQEALKLDGIWIDSKLDVYNYQAPAGGIFNINDWKIKQVLNNKHRLKS